MKLLDILLLNIYPILSLIRNNIFRIEQIDLVFMFVSFTHLFKKILIFGFKLILLS